MRAYVAEARFQLDIGAPLVFMQWPQPLHSHEFDSERAAGPGKLPSTACVSTIGPSLSVHKSHVEHQGIMSAMPGFGLLLTANPAQTTQAKAQATTNSRLTLPRLLQKNIRHMACLPELFPGLRSADYWRTPRLRTSWTYTRPSPASLPSSPSSPSSSSSRLRTAGAAAASLAGLCRRLRRPMPDECLPKCPPSEFQRGLRRA